jgi:hypothetical protein
MTFVPHGDKMITSILNSQDFDTKPLSQKHRRDTFGASDRDLQKHENDDSGVYKEPMLGSNIALADRIVYNEIHNYHEYLDGPNLQVFIDKTLDYFVKSINAEDDPNPFEVADLYEFVRDKLFDAMIRALCGEELLKIAPTFANDFWTFDDQITQLFKGFPKWMIPKAYAS